MIQLPGRAAGRLPFTACAAAVRPLGGAGERLPAHGAFLLHERELLGELPHHQPGLNVGHFARERAGHGALAVAKRLYEIGARRFAVARLSEAEELRPAVSGSEILILAPTCPDLAPSLLKGDFTQAVNDKKYADALSKNVPEGAKLKIALAVDTGMGRLGFPAAASDPADEILAVASDPRLLPVSI